MLTCAVKVSPGCSRMQLEIPWPQPATALGNMLYWPTRHFPETYRVLRWLCSSSHDHRILTRKLNLRVLLESSSGTTKTRTQLSWMTLFPSSGLENQNVWLAFDAGTYALSFSGQWPKALLRSVPLATRFSQHTCPIHSHCLPLHTCSSSQQSTSQKFYSSNSMQDPSTEHFCWPLETGLL